MVFQDLLAPQVNISSIKMVTDDLIFGEVVECKEVVEGQTRQYLTLLGGHAIVSSETKAAELARQVTAGAEVLSRCGLKDGCHRIAHGGVESASVGSDGGEVGCRA